MLISVQIYKQTFTLLILAAYLTGLFSTPILEGVHFLAHLGSDTAHHSLADHSEAHSHELLNLLNDASDDNSTEDAPVLIDNTIKKLVQNIGKNLTVNELEIKARRPSFSFLSIHTDNFFHIAHPPPEA